MISSPIILNQNESKYMVYDENNSTIEDSNKEIKIYEELKHNDKIDDEIKYLQDFIDSYFKNFKLITHFPSIFKLDFSSIRQDHAIPKQECYKIENEKLFEDDANNKITKKTNNIWVSVDSLFSYFRPVVNYINFNNKNDNADDDERFGLRPISELILRVNHFNFF
jgi:hypothetical protein